MTPSSESTLASPTQGTHLFFRAAAALAVLLGVVGQLVGQTTYYGPDYSSSGNSFGTAASFTWDTSTLIWNTDSRGAGAGTNWVSGTNNSAFLTTQAKNSIATALTVTLGSTIVAGSLSVDAAVLTTGGSWTIAAPSTTSLTLNTASTTGANLTLSGGTFTMAGTGSYSFIDLNVTASSTLDFGTAGVTSLALTNLRIATGATLTIQNWVRFSDQLTVANAPITGGTVSGVTITGGTAVVAGADISKSNINFANYGELAKWNSGSFSTNQLAAVPEPSTYGAIMAAGCAGLIGWRRRRSRREAAAKA